MKMLVRRQNRKSGERVISELPLDILKQFEKYEKQLEADKQKAKREAELAESATRDAMLLRKKRMEQLVIALTIVFSIAVFGFGYYSYQKGKVTQAEPYTIYGGMGGGKGSQVDCLDPRFVNSGICRTQRLQKSEQSWQGISTHVGGKDNPFSLHDKPSD